MGLAATDASLTPAAKIAATTTTTTTFSGDSSPKSACSPDLSYLPAFNDVGGRPEERRGTHGSFRPGMRIMSGGQARDVPLETEINRGKVLFVSSVHKPDLSAEARTNAIRPSERLGCHGRFTPGAKRFLGGKPRDVPLEEELDHGKVLFVSSVHKPDMSSTARTNLVRPTERLGSGGRFTPGARRWLGGKPRDVPIQQLRDPGTIIFESSTCKPDLSREGGMNVLGGREDERCGRLGSFEHGVVEMSGGPLYMHASSLRELALWHEAGQKENRYRRCVPSHFVAGVSILSGGMPVY